MARRERYVLLGIVVAIALLIRAGYVATTHVKDPLRQDAGQYVQYAHNLLQHGTYSKDENAPPVPDSFRSPGYPLFLAAAMVLGGEEGYYPLARWTQVALGTAMVPLAFFLGLAFLPFWAALCAAVLVALSPHLVTATGYILTETLFGFTLLLGLLLLARGAARQRPGALCAAALVLGYAALVNEACTFLPPALAGAVLLHRRGRAAPRLWFAPALVFCAVVGSWQVRNVLVVEDGDRASARALSTLSHGSYPGWVHRDARYRYSAYLEDPEQPEFGSSWARFRSVFWQRFTERPTRHLAWYLLEKPCYLWSWDILQGQGDIYVYPVGEPLYVTTPAAEGTRLLMKALHAPLLVLAALGLGLCAARRRRLPTPLPLLLGTTVAYFTAIHALFAPWPRYSVPLRPELYLLAVWSLVAVAQWFAARRERTAPEPAAG